MRSRARRAAGRDRHPRVSAAAARTSARAHAAGGRGPRPGGRRGFHSTQCCTAAPRFWAGRRAAPPPVCRLRVSPRLVQRPQLLPRLVGVDLGRQQHPRMLPVTEHRDRRLREVRVGEGADRHGDRVGRVLGRVEDRRAALRAEAERAPLPRLVRGSRVGTRPAGDAHRGGGKPRLRPKRAARAALAGEAVADRDPHRIAVCLEPQPAARTRCLASAHGPESYETVD